MIASKRVRWLCGSLMLSLLAMSTWAQNCSEPASITSTVREQIALTVYDQNFALVSERRPLSLKQGMNEVALLTISPLLDTQSLLLTWDDRSALRPDIIAHTYDLGVQGAGSLLRRYIGKTVQLIRYGQDGQPASMLHGTLLSTDEEGPVLAAAEFRSIDMTTPPVSQGIYVNPQGTLLLPTESGAPTLPTLRLQLHAPETGEATLQLSYLTSGLGWSADYVATLHEENTLQLACWATLTNQTGLAFPNARVSLVTGAPSPFIAQTAVARLDLAYRARVPAERDTESVFARQVAPQPLGELYAYPIRRVVSIGDAQQSRLLLYEASRVPVKKRYTYRAPTLSASGTHFIGKEPQRSSVEVALIFENRKEHGLGLPLPRGSVRIYELDRAAIPRYLGTAELPATPVNRKVTLSFGRAFDLFGEWQPLRQTVVRRGVTRYEVQMTLHNAKGQPAEIYVIQPFSGSWQILSASHSYERLSATAAQWVLKLPAGGTLRLRFTAEVRSL